MHTLLAATLLATIDLASAQRALTELDAMCAADAGRMWGRSICGPIVFAERQTRDAVRRDGDRIETAKVPDTLGIANTAVEWDGRTWTMVMWPLPQNPVSRRALLGHESFHRLQKELGLPQSNPRNAHLDSADARYWMRLEWRALARALTTGEKSAVEDALAFRAQRRATSGEAAEEERLLEMNEGLSEHTGYALAIPSIRERVAPLVKKLANAEKSETFARSFAYTSGPAWCALIELKDPQWTRRIKASDDLGELARRVWKIDRASTVRVSEYGGDALRAEEDTRATKKRELMAKLRAKFIDGPVLTIPLKSMQFTFDPNHVQPLDEFGTVYESMEARDVWGKIVVTGGALISPDYSRLVVPKSGEGWTLTLAEGWSIVGDSVAESPRP